jgi:hypothetical protein
MNIDGKGELRFIEVVEKLGNEKLKYVFFHSSA